MVEQTTPSVAPLQTPVLAEELVTPEKNDGIFNNTFVDVLAGLSSLMVGGVTFWRSVDERAHKNLSSMMLNEDIKKERFDLGNQLREEVIAGKAPPAVFGQRYKQAIKFLEDKMDERFSRAGVSSIWSKFGLLRNHQKWAVAIETVAIGGIALGTILVTARQVLPGGNDEKKKEEKKNFRDRVAEEPPQELQR